VQYCSFVRCYLENVLSLFYALSFLELLISAVNSWTQCFPSFIFPQLLILGRFSSFGILWNATEVGALHRAKHSRNLSIFSSKSWSLKFTSFSNFQYLYVNYYLIRLKKNLIMPNKNSTYKSDKLRVQTSII